ncbi:hypothetical protein OS493_006109 [Desmophyllum pertusum]|uniref:Uncharacterized protein n=1 Tax=Desmophyllum pertusum TaxID=174260 RepID=A0A9W9YFU6_9CNID|nr:hypothetical protein OS493_006109 [Desmophyllum pertusum]
MVVLVKVFLASTVEPAKHFTRQMTTAVLAHKTTQEETVRCPEVSNVQSFDSFDVTLIGYN